MKKILVALAVAGFGFLSANAQTEQINVCGVKQGQVCTSNKKGASCYRTQYAENFKVCKNNSGYFICCETPNATNSTHPWFTVRETKPYNKTYVMQYDREEVMPTAAPPTGMTAPQSQSYPANTGFGMSSATSYEGYYPNRRYIKVCYGGDNVAELNSNPYHGCPSPQSEGPDVNNERNINANNASYDLPPVTGRPEER